MQPDEDIRAALTTFPDMASAETCVRALLAAELIACGTMLPGSRSIYRWAGQIEEADEVAVVLKFSAAHTSGVFERLSAIHPYDVPEFLAFTPSEMSPEYANWVSRSGAPPD